MMIDNDKSDSACHETEADSGHSEPEETEEERPKPPGLLPRYQLVFRMRQEPRYVSMKLIRRKQYQMRRV
jgi:hypothetical protein